MNKRKLIREVARRTGFSIRVSKIIVECLIENISLALKQGDKVALKDFGAFCNIDRQGKRYYDIPTGKIKTFSARKVVKFIPYKKFKEQLRPNLLVHEEDDGSIGTSIKIESRIFFNTKTGIRPEPGQINIGPRGNRQSEAETFDLSFEGNFLFEHFLGENEHKSYPSLKVPQKDTPILMPQVDKTGVTIGAMEPVLHEYLINMCKEIDGIKVLENVKLPILNRNYSYRPDFCLYWKKKKLYIDIEIDEPYDIVSRKPIHYQGNGDILRDRYFIRNGWCVIRFAERQMVDNIEGVINYIKRILRWLTEDNEIKFHENTLEDINRWSYEEAAEMSSDNTREHYLNLPHYVSTDVPVGSKISPKTFTFIKPAEDILPESVAVQEKFGLIDRIKQSNCEHCVVTKSNGYKWIYICNSLKISPKNGVNILEGQSPLGIELPCLLDEIEDIAPLKELFSDVHWESQSSMSLKDYDILREILFDAIANGKPIWIAYNSNNSGYGTRFLSNIAYSWHITHYFAPHIGLGHCTKYGMSSLSHFHAYCSNRKEFRMFAADGRIKKLKVLNCSHVYFVDEEYANSFARLVMYPYESHNGNAFFENADEILHIMPQNELKSTFVQGNLANVQVMKGEIDKAIMTYKKFPFDYFISPSLTWGETCISDIHYFINLCKEHLNDGHFYEGLDANILLHNFEEVLKLLTQSSWMHDYN